MERTWCHACGVEKEDGKHPNTTCTEKEWAAHQGRMLREIINLLKAPAQSPVQSAKTDAAKQKGV
jgi:hypothetical protein